ncbi:MAG: hypothetical protein JWP59_3143 [Massilia sp.]|nr:hypothetical protein [Massilia sp.]
MKNNRLGVVLIVSSLLMITLVVWLMLQRQADAHAAQIRAQGLGVTRSLSALPMSTLAPGAGRAGVLNSLFALQDNPDFAYAAVVAPGGAALAEVARAGATVAVSALPTGTPSLFGERTIDGAAGSRSVREFYGPVLEEGVLKGFVRVAYFAPERMLTGRDLPFFGVLALAMFLLVPLAWLLIRRELAPLGAIGAQLGQLIAATQEPEGRGGVIGVPRDARDLAEHLQQFLLSANARINALERDSVKALADGRLLEYGSNKMHAVLHCMPDGVLILDPSGEITFANSKIEPLLGAAIDAVLSSNIDQWCRDAPLRTLLARYRSDSMEAGRQAGVEFSPVAVPHKRLVATAQPLVGADGAIAFGTLVVLRDATREHLAQQAGNDFVAHVSHELKSPLNVIVMYAEMLQDAAPDDLAMRVEAINVIQDEVERMAALVNNLLNVSKLETGSMSPERHRIKLDDLLRDAFNHALPRAESRNMTLDLQVPRELAAVSIDKDLFRIALNNLMTNAIKYNRDGGTVSLIAEEGDNDIVVTVRDSGIGIPHEDQAHIFEKFYRARDGEAQSRGGHGLGLYLACQIVELHHGRITLDSEPGRGSAFSIHLKKMAPLTAGINSL